MSTMLTIAPRASARCGAASCEMNSGARRLDPISSSKCEASIAPTSTGKKLEALLTTRSRRPKLCSAAATSARGAIGASSSAFTVTALHAPGGYYAGGMRKFGAEGDFVTAPELGRLFGRTLARQLKELLNENRRVLEIGAGSGALAKTLLDELSCEYFILETSAGLRDRQRERLGDRASWLDSLPARFGGVIIANEVVDAMPVHAVAWSAQGIMERGVAADGGALLW